MMNDTMKDLGHLRHELADRSSSLISDASHLTERGLHGAARAAEEQASHLRSALPSSVRQRAHLEPRGMFARRSPARVLLIALVIGAIAVVVYRRRATAPASLPAETASGSTGSSSNGSSTGTSGTSGKRISAA